jgi:hypothetical protein
LFIVFSANDGSEESEYQRKLKRDGKRYLQNAEMRTIEPENKNNFLILKILMTFYASMTPSL